VYLLSFYAIFFVHIQNVPGGRINILGCHSIVHSKQKICMYICPVPKGFRDWTISPYSSKIIDNKEILRIVSNTVFTVQVTKWVQFTHYNTFSRIPLSTSMHFATRMRTSHSNSIEHILHLWRCAEFLKTLLQCHYQQSQRPTDASHRFTCFRQWRSTAGRKDNIWRQIQTTVQWSNCLANRKE
jgi:hypothetical protein